MDNLAIEPVHDGDGEPDYDGEDDGVLVIRLSPEVVQKIEDECRRSLMVKILNPQAHKSIEIRDALPKAWRLTGSVQARTIPNSSEIYFVFDSDSDLQWVLSQSPWTFKDWVLVIDRYTERDSPDYLRFVSFWVEIIGIPWNYRHEGVIREVGSLVGRVLEVDNRGPGVRALIRVDVNECLEFERGVIFGGDADSEAVEVRFVYENLKMFCRDCGSLAHHRSRCPLP